MNEEELEKTKPIEVLSELKTTPVNDNPPVTETREEKYQDKELIEEQKIAEEEAEEALAEKNIAEAEALLKQENQVSEPAIQEKKEGVLSKIKNKWNNLEKKKKILAVVIAILLLILITILIVYLVTKKDEPTSTPKEPQPNKVEEAPVITDNFYYRDGKLYFTDEKEEVLGNYECENKDSNLCYVAYNDNRDHFDSPKLQDESGKDITKRMEIYEDRYAFIIDNKDANDKTIKLFSMTDGKLVGTYLSAKAYKDNYIIVEDTSKNYGLLKIDDGVNELIKPQYNYLGMMEEQEYLIAQNKKGYIVIDKDNKNISSSLPSNIKVKSYNNNMVVAKINNDYNVYDYKANLIVGGYAFASVTDNYIALVDNDKHLTIRGIDKVKYNEGDITLDTTNYVKTYIYDKDGNIKKVKRSYELSVKNDKVEVAVYDNEGEVYYENVEFLQGQANKKYQYLNYFNGKLYFYKDAEKEELIGSYTCSNKNYIETDSDTYNTCFPAKDVINDDNDMMKPSELNRKSTTPLINNRYVFIADGSNTITLYDLQQSKSLGKYHSVDTSTPNNDYTFTSYQGNLEVIGINKSGKYGVLSFDANGVSAKYRFDYNRIERIGKYLQMTEDDSKWYIAFDEENESPKFSGKIMSYTNDLKHFALLNNKKYSVANSDGKTEIAKTFDYVELYNGFFAGVDDKKEIHIYDYVGDEQSSSTVKVMDYPYSKTENPAFHIKKEGTTYIASIYNGNAYENKEFKPLDKTNQDKEPEEEKTKEN
ncbi:MAG TPA: hypothetical protein DCE23_06725 [Firmicutes bacterium]|nr:hypothetical protein [Bacillota bacterium]